MRLRKSLEWATLFPALLFGRYFLPLVVVFFSLFVNLRMGAYVALCWYCIAVPCQCSVVTVLITEPMKYLFGRQRPCEEDIPNRVIPLRKDLTNPAFPSGDSAQVSLSSVLDSRRP